MKNILIYILVSLATILFVEVFLNYTRVAPPTLKKYDKDFGSVNRKDIRYFKAVEGIFIGNTNYDGRFSENYAPRKANKEVLRIGLMGDSFVEGIDVIGHNHFGKYIEELLGKSLGRKVEVLNLGRGNSTVHSVSYYFLNHVYKNYDVDILLVFADERDMPDLGENYNFPSTSYKLDANNGLVPHYGWKNTSEYKIHEKLAGNPILQYYDYSTYFRLLYRALARVNLSGFNYMTFGKFSGEKAIDKFDNYNKPDTRDTVSTLTKIIYDSLYHIDNGQVVFVTRDKPVNAPELLKYLTAKGYPVINVADTFSGFNIRNTNIDGYYFKATNAYGGHWNNNGHKAVGYFLSGKLLQHMDSYIMPNYQK